ncbi:amidohydrolase family protein [Pseudorhodoferax sp.]|uniref:amidohydrolase family protein n=1 Tax=Pseudorhodoferax sp. TaxID=1993553 RepID=UPI0039E3335E
MSGPADGAAGAACDAHVHVFEPARFPYAPARRFTPGRAGVDELQRHLRRIGAGRVVLVQPSVYGHDHGCLLDALAALRGAGRGVAVPAPDATPEQIARLDAAGVRAARVNLVVEGIADAAAARQAVARAAARIPAHWHVQLHLRLETVHALAGLLRTAGRHFVLDHLGLPDGPAALRSPAWRSLCGLVAAGAMSVKLSAPYLSAPAPYAALRPFVRDLASANPGALVWGSNWPHTQGAARSAAADPAQAEPFREVDDRAWLAQCRAWLAAQGLPAGTLEGNAARLYGFGAG